jgi:hypothetical protein
MDLTRMDMDRMRLVQGRSRHRALVNTAIKPGFHKGRIFHTQLSNHRLLAGDYAARVIDYTYEYIGTHWRHNVTLSAALRGTKTGNFVYCAAYGAGWVTLLSAKVLICTYRVKSSDVCVCACDGPQCKHRCSRWAFERLNVTAQGASTSPNRIIHLEFWWIFDTQEILLLP